MMRIITGKAKGIRLKTLEGDVTRPTSERVKEAVFSMIQSDIEDREVLDLFSGSGQMALEALSRGAAYAVMLDNSLAAIKIINENAEKTKLTDKCSVRREDYMDYIKRNRGKKFDLIFLDPPYASGYYSIALRALWENDLLKPTTMIICESGEDTIYGKDTALASYFTTVKQSRYSKTFITILSPTEKNGDIK